MKANAGKRKIFDAVDLRILRRRLLRLRMVLSRLRLMISRRFTTIRFICMKVRDCRIWFRALRNMGF